MEDSLHSVIARQSSGVTDERPYYYEAVCARPASSDKVAGRRLTWRERA